jgi:hypothetical protein
MEGLPMAAQSTSGLRGELGSDASTVGTAENRISGEIDEKSSAGLTDRSLEESAADPAAIERDILKTQDEMSETVARIVTQLEPQNLSDTLMNRAARNAQHNPLALALIAGGFIWLVKGKFSQAEQTHLFETAEQEDYPSHVDYLEHMRSVEWSAGEDAASFQRRRQAARASFFRVEQRPGEDEGRFAQRIELACDQFRQKCGLADQSAASSTGSVRRTGQAAVNTARGFYARDPMTGGLVAAAAGAIVGTVLPLARAEEEQLSAVGKKVRSNIGDQKQRLVARVSS